MDREVKLDWSIYSFELTVDGPLNRDDVGQFSINKDYAEAVTVEENFAVKPTEPIRKGDLTNFLMDLAVPEEAAVELALRVVKDE